MKRFAIMSACLLSGLVVPSRTPAETPKSSPSPTVQIALLLDTSNSMDGLIAQAKTQLWNVVNEFVKAKKNGRTPVIQVALVEYGKLTLSANEGYVRMILPLTDDLDKVSEELFALRTNGGEEYCGWVIREAVNKLEWSKTGDVYKAIFIAGNEPFTQGPVDFHASCRSAIERGIVVNTIFCGPNATGGTTGWRDGAVLADGSYMSIDQNQKVVEIPTPHDAEIARLGVDLNKTPYGKTSPIEHDGRGVFTGLPMPFEATRYHSLLVEKSSVPPELEVSAWTAEGEIMGVRHKAWPLHGVQFHPESFLTVEGPRLLRNFLELAPVR